jgi:hypothetical protein
MHQLTTSRLVRRPPLASKPILDIVADIEPL